MSSQLYQALDSSKQEIRILIVDTQDFYSDGTLSCRLEIASLLDEPRPYFEALSWTWGDPTHSKYITIDGHKVGVSANAEEVLRHVCYEQKHGRVWLDAVCINQSDLHERGQQVSMMDEIYSRTARVLVWLGQEDETTEKALRNIDQILAQCQKLTNGFQSLEQRLLQEYSSRPHSEVPLPQCDWPAILKFYAAPWFFRVWVHQEVMLCKEALVFQGRHSRSWFDISLAAQWLSHSNFRQYSRHMTDDPGLGVDKASRIWRFTRQPPGATGYLSMTMYLGATDPRDKVYGILGLLRSVGNDTFKLTSSYEASLRDVYTKATKLAIHADGLAAVELAQGLVPVSEGQELESDDSPWPSWVPHYNWRDYRPGGSPAMPDLPLQIGAAGSEPLRLRFDDDNADILTLGGCVVDTITKLGSILDMDLILSASRIAKEVSDCRAMVPLVPDLDFALTMVQGLDYNRTRPSEHIMNQFPAFAQECRAKLTGQCHAELLHDDDSLTYFSNIAWDYANTINVHSRNRRFFVTEKGYMGTSFPKTQVGDKVCILYGSTMPFVLRKVEERWRLLGTAYVHDIMEGEYVQRLREASRLQEESHSFDIC
ncbi:Heterokaryon incompatibility protein 6, OR allele [Fulvia fulva]|nr:Heterokaryon incompatibility protein 6, OR allele [Fulvia fulva]KAK4611454.1 Heterokaryon incompatibility protein 6, OR allele [Fulvia fulva]WPV21972.1 Heterokaryon incompatibility protein 6, OR allele [Fulvia fulva]